MAQKINEHKIWIVVIIIYLVISTINLIRCWLNFADISSFNKILMVISFMVNCWLIVILIIEWKKYKDEKTENNGDKK